MTDDRKSGIAFIAGSIGGVLTMAIHPGSAMSPATGGVTLLVVVAAIAHSLALVSVLLLFLGGCGLSRRVAGPDRMAFIAIVVYGFGCVAAMIAGAVSGFIIPAIMKHMARDVPAAADEWRMIIDSIFQVNQAFSRIFAVAASAAMILWSAAALRNGGLGHRIATYGWVMGALIILAVGSGHLRLNVHGMTVVVVGQVIWFVIVGAQMYRRPESPGSNDAPRSAAR